MSEDNAEQEFPILCETCLGENPFVRMTKEAYGKACKICDRPFTVYRWRPGPKARYKKTELCPTCAKIKNVCQTCVLDLEFGLPVQVRDTAISEQDKMTIPGSDVNKQFMIEQREQQVQEFESNYGKVQGEISSSLARLRRSDPYYKRNLPHLCSFYAKGQCNRGDTCPYRHEMPQTGELAKQNIKDRYYGVNDPVAKKLMRRANEPGAAPVPPEDQSVTTLWIGNIDEKTSEADLRQIFYLYGEISAVRIVPLKGCAFVTFVRRDSAEEAAARLYKDTAIHGQKLRISWGRAPKNVSGTAPPGVRGTAQPLVYEPDATKHLTVPSSFVPPSAPPSSSDFSDMSAPPGVRSSRPYYPSMDPKNLASKIE